MKDKEDPQAHPVYWDTERNQFYWIEWYDTGNSEIPTKHYIEIGGK